MAKKPRKDRKPVLTPLYDIERIASSTDYTGIAPTPIMDQDAAETYAQLFGVHTMQVDEEETPRE